MIICHPLKIIFIKTKKVAGTSFEIALSAFCGPDCVITPISAKDEITRKNLGFRGPQNFLTQDALTASEAGFYNHMTAGEVRALIPKQVWDEYLKVTIVRNPFEVVVSRYFWEMGGRESYAFDDFLRENPSILIENQLIAPASGPDQLDAYLKYETLEEDLAFLGGSAIWNVFSQIKAKADVRPKGRSIADMYGRHPQAISLVERACSAEFQLFGYDKLSQSQGMGANS